MRTTTWAVLATLLLITGGCCCARQGTPRPTAGGTPDAAFGVSLETAREDAYVAKVISADAIEIMKSADKVLLASVDPEVFRDAGNPDAEGAKPYPHALARLDQGEGVFGMFALSEGDRRKAARGIASLPFELLEVAECYDPRHALLFMSGTDRVLVILCFDCDRIVVLDESTPYFQTYYLEDESHAVRDWLNALIDAEGIERDKPPEPEDDWDEDEDW